MAKWFCLGCEKAPMMPWSAPCPKCCGWPRRDPRTGALNG